VGEIDWGADAVDKVALEIKDHRSVRLKGKALQMTTSQKVFEGKAAVSQTMLLLCEKGMTRAGLGFLYINSESR